MRLAVTGAQGLLGRQLVSTALNGGAEAVLGLGRSPRSDDRFTHDLEWLGRRVPAPLPAALRPAAVDDRYEYARVDLCDVGAVSAVARQFRPDAVIHAAAALRDEGWDRLVASNMNALFGLVRGFASQPPPKLVLTSTGSVYGAARGSSRSPRTGRRSRSSPTVRRSAPARTSLVSSPPRAASRW